MALRVFFWLFCVICLGAPRPGAANDVLTAPAISAVGGFFAGDAPRKRKAVERIGLTGLRDALRWADVEDKDGQMALTRGSAATMAALREAQVLGTLMLLPQTPHRHEQKTVIKPRDLRAFAGFAAATARAFPAAQIEIANEFNGGAFVSGPAKAMAPHARARLHAEMLRKVTAAGVPATRIIGGALHSMAGGYLWALLDAGGADHMAQFAVHPYTTQPEAFVRQLAVLRRHPAAAALEVAVTEFGTKEVAGAADFFWRAYCQFAKADVALAHWYPLDARKDGYAPILGPDLHPTEVGRALLWARQAVAGRIVQAFDPDAHTYGCLFDRRILVIWGAPRAVIDLRGDLQMHTPSGGPASQPMRLSRDRVLILQAPEGSAALVPRRDIALARQAVLFDSFDHFVFPPEPGAHSLVSQDREHDLRTCPGQDRPQAPWFPHLCAAKMPRAVWHDRGFVLPHQRATFVTRYTMTKPAAVEIRVSLLVHARSEDGMRVRIRSQSEVLYAQQVQGGEDIILTPGHLGAGAQIEVALSHGASMRGDRGKFHMQVVEVLPQ
ncbi:MAG: hypothetical protein AAF943_14680 [Pseudomonadota bacterium]